MIYYNFRLEPTKTRGESNLYICITGEEETEKLLGQIKTLNWDSKQNRLRVFDLTSDELKKYLLIKEEIIKIEKAIDAYKQELRKNNEGVSLERIQKILSQKYIQAKSQHNNRVQKHIDNALREVKNELLNIQSLIDKGEKVSDTQLSVINELNKLK